MQIIPTITEKEFPLAEARLNKLVETAKWVQIDVLDNSFKPGKSFELELLNSIDLQKNFLWDIHLMVKNPIKWIEKCVFVESQRIIGQVEMMESRKDFINKIKDFGLEAGLAFDINTPIDSNIPPNTDWILLMGRPSGFGRYPFDSSVLEKIKTIKKLGFPVAIDGGVDRHNLPLLQSLNVDIIYSGSNYFDLLNEKN